MPYEVSVSTEDPGSSVITLAYQHGHREAS